MNDTSFHKHNKIQRIILKQFQIAVIFLALINPVYVNFQIYIIIIRERTGLCRRNSPEKDCFVQYRFFLNHPATCVLRVENDKHILVDKFSIPSG